MQGRGWIRNHGSEGIDVDFQYDFLSRGRRLQAVESNFIGEHNFFQQIVYALSSELVSTVVPSSSIQRRCGFADFDYSEMTPSHVAFIETAKPLGFPEIDDFNGPKVRHMPEVNFVGSL